MARALAALVALLLALAPSAAAGDAAERAAVFAGTGVWVDIYDPYHARPDAAVAIAARYGVDAIYVETGNSTQALSVVRKPELRRLVQLAHARGIRVISWYLLDLVRPGRDLRRLIEAARLGPPGDRVDGVGVDIEASTVRDPVERTRRLVRVVDALRRARPTLAIGAIIPSPPGMARLPRYWPGFPYAALRVSSDAFLPMCYASYRSLDVAGTHRYARACVDGIREGTGDPDVPIHVIGGIAGDLSTREMVALARGARQRRVAGFSLYDLVSSGPGAWRALDVWER